MADTFGVPGVIRDSSIPTPDNLGDEKLLIKVYAWAINPADYMLQNRNLGKYPVILGCDVAGTVECILPNSTAASLFSVGDRVFGFTANNGFQDYVTLDYRLVAKLPDHMAYSEAVVLGLCAATSAMFLFGKDYLHLDYPKSGATRKGKSVLVWGGSSAVGSNAIQLATAAGYDVVTTCSERNFDYVKKLGAIQAFDYRDNDVPGSIAAEIDSGECAGFFMAAGLEEGNLAAYKVATASNQRINFSSSSFVTDLGNVPEGVHLSQATVENIKPFPYCWFETLSATFGGYLPEALATGTYKVAPPPLVVNRQGLEGIQEAVDRMREGTVSAVKLVVERP
ncbi:hypothetical protein SLS60_005733 [Paraconiothyrium brasiliense]|uniref:Enoyl reductase (ER) domain-containing protein n=1 Tax=Paraconiothyrium brasiliense TaxID=300254 RepID=A0ABR3RI82_9PLEO